MLTPFVPSARQRYARLLPPDSREVNEALLSAIAKLAGSMNTAIQANENSPIPAGYTYFGQFIDHDLSLDLTPLDKAGQLPPYLTTNQRTPWLDLGHLYGDGPESTTHWHLYDDDRASLRLGANNLPGNRSFDVPVDENGQAQLAEDRNNENLIVRQIHAMFLKLHNRAVQELSAQLPARERFEAARNRVRWQYQWLVRHDFLRRICQSTVYNRVIGDGTCPVDFQARGFSIPVEFAQAAFRFGHSMVRSQYVLNTDPPPPGAPPGLAPSLGVVNLDVLFAEPHRPGTLQPKWRVDWVRFLAPGGQQQGREPAVLIDTHLSDPLFHLPPEAIGSSGGNPSGGDTPSLPLRTLTRGTKTRLATGEQVAKAFGRSPLRTDFPQPGVWAALDDAGLTDNTPLWYYVLLEAQLEAEGRSLGTVGSSIVAAVIESSLRDDRNSFTNWHGAGWVPPPWKSPKGELIQVKTLLDVAKIVDLA